MNRRVDPLAGKPAEESQLIDVPGLLEAYFDSRPDPAVAVQRVSFGTSGHRGNALERSFNEWHVLAITQAIVDYRESRAIGGPMYVGIDTHALSRPALGTVLEVLAGNAVETVIAAGGEFTPTPVISHAILDHNRRLPSSQADGIVVTPSHNPPDNGGIKYNPPHGGPAESPVTSWIENRANTLLEEKLRHVRRQAVDKGHPSPTIHERDFRAGYVKDLAGVIDFEAIRRAGIRIGVDPLGGAGIHYWDAIAERYGIDITVVNEELDPAFAFMTLDWDGKIRMDPSSPYAMRRLIGLRERFDVAFACDTDHDRHGIVTPRSGLLEANHYLCVMAEYLFRHRPQWNPAAGIGKTLVSSALIDRIAARLDRSLYEVPVGFKWFVEGLYDGSLGFAGEESAGASFQRHNGSVWTTDKDGIVPSLLAAEITARTGEDPGRRYRALTLDLGAPVFERIDAPATARQKAKLATLSPEALSIRTLAGERVEQILDRAPGNHAFIDGIKVVAANGWFAARPSGTEDIYKIYAESFKGQAHLRTILEEAQQLVDSVLAEPMELKAAGKGQ